MRTVLTLVFFALSLALQSQDFSKYIPAEKLEGGQLTLYDYREAFDSYCREMGAENGFYINAEGEMAKLPYWKLFKRWEWYWEDRVDPATGRFPETCAWEKLNEHLADHPAGRSISGNWTPLGPDSSPGGYAGLGRINCVGFNPDDNNVVYAGTASGGIWKSTSGGSSWIPIGDGNPVLGVSDIIVISQPGGPDILYIATGDRDRGSVWALGGGQGNDNNSVGVLKSVDGGATWNTTGLSFTPNQKKMTSRLLKDPANSDILFAATTDGLYRTSNGGAAWTQLSTLHFIDMEFHPGNPAIMYASTKESTTRVYRSANGGVSWTEVLAITGQRTELAVSPDQPDWVYALVAGDDSGLEGVYKSTNSGASFTQAYSGATKNLLGWNCNGGDSGGQGWYDLAIAADPNNASIIFVGGVNTWKSTSGGTTFTICNHWSSSCGGTASVAHADKHNLVFQNGSSTLWEVNDGGIYRSANGGSSWTHLTNDMAISQIYRLGVAQTTPDDVILGLQDNGSKALLNGTWDDVLGGDGMECAIDPTNHNIQYASVYYGDLYRTTNHWGSSTGINQSGMGDGWWVTPYLIDPNNHNTLIAGFTDVWRTTNQGNSWTQISNFGSSNTLRSLCIAPSNSNYIYTATTSTLYRTTNGGTSWTDITGTLPTGSCNITYISVKEDDPNTVWVSLGQYNDFGVFESTNGGSTWANISTGLLQIPVMCVIQNRQNTTETELYAATDVGVYVKAGSSPWESFYDSIPNVVVIKLAVNYDDVTPENSRIRAATYGRGLWESELYTSGGVPSADVLADMVFPDTTQTVTFTDLSTNNPTSWAWEITPASFNYMNSTGPSSQEPQVMFSDTGYFSVTLISTNAFGSDTAEKTDYIHVPDCFNNTLPFEEDFSAGYLPWCWYNIDQFGNGQVWRFDNPAGRTVNTTTADNGFAILDSDYYGSGGTQNADLVSPMMDLSSIVAARLEFEHYFEGYAGSSATLLYSTDGGGSWQLLQNWTSSTGNADLYSENISGLVAGEAAVRFKWNYSGSFGNYWAIDDISVNGATELPSADFSADVTSVTAGEAVTFTDLSTGDPDSWMWVFAGGDPASYSGQTPPPVTYGSPGSYTVSLNVSNEWGDSTLVIAGYISAGYAPEADFEADDTTIAAGGTVTFTDASLNDPDAWTWTFNGGDPGSFIGQDPPPILYQEPGIYNVALHVSNPFGDSTLLRQEYIHVGEALQVVFSASQTTVYPGETIDFTDLSSGDPDTWQWAFSGAFPSTSSAQHPSGIKYDEPGLYDVTLTVSNTFGTASETYANYIDVLPVGLQELDEHSVNIYPNPNEGRFQVRNLLKKNINILILNAIGQSVFPHSLEPGTSRIDLSGYGDGPYQVRLTDPESGKYIYRLVICK